MKIKTNSTLPQLAFAIMLFSSYLAHSMPTPHKSELAKMAAFAQLNEFKNHGAHHFGHSPFELDNVEPDTIEIPSPFKTELKDAYSLRSQVKQVKFINNLHELFALENDDTEISETLARHFKVTVNGVEIPYAQERTIPVVGNRCDFGLTIPDGKLSKVMVLGAALLKKPLSFLAKMGIGCIGLIDQICNLVNNPPSLSFHFSCKLDEESEVEYASDFYASHRVPQNNFNPVTIYQEACMITQGETWSDWHIRLK